MPQCPSCGKIFESERGASVHLHYCPKRTVYNLRDSEQGRQRRKEGKDVFNSKLRWRMKQVSVSTTN